MTEGAVDAGERTLAWRDIPLRFAVHMVVGAAMFVTIGLVTVLLHWFVQWMKTEELPKYAIFVVSAVKWSLFGGDILLYAIYFLRTLKHHLQVFWETTVE
jgi:hypothetical protein